VNLDGARKVDKTIEVEDKKFGSANLKCAKSYYREVKSRIGKFIGADNLPMCETGK